MWEYFDNGSFRDGLLGRNRVELASCTSTAEATEAVGSFVGMERRLETAEVRARGRWGQMDWTILCRS